MIAATKKNELDVRTLSIARLADDADQKTTTYKLARTSIHDGDLLAFRGTGLIPRHGRSQYSHVGTAAWRRADQSTLLIAESREQHGGRLVTLSSQVRAYPGLIDVYRPTHQCPEGIRQRAATIAVNWSGQSYSYPGVLRMTLMHYPIARLIAEAWNGRKYDPTDMTLSTWDEPKVCSQLHAWAYRLAAVELKIETEWDPCPNLGDRWIEPADLARSGSYRLVYRGLVV